MAPRLVSIDRKSPILFPPYLREWIPDNHIETLGFSHFYLRGLEKFNLEWDIITLAYNFKRVLNITGGLTLSANGVLKAVNC